MQELWKRIERALERLAPSVLTRIQPGVSASTIRQAEMRMNMTFPEEIATFYRLHNGCVDSAMGLLDTWNLYSLERMVSTWDYFLFEHFVEHQQDLLHQDPKPQTLPEETIQPLIWHPRWIPFMNNSKADHYFLDLASGPKGHVGQIISVPQGSFLPDYYEPLNPEHTRTLMAPSLQTFLESIACQLEAGRYTFDDTTGVLWSQEGFGLPRKSSRYAQRALAAWAVAIIL